MSICLIPARGGSKRIPRKNIKDFCGKPMIGWSIEAARRAGCFDRIIISTDDAEIADVAKTFGAEVPFMRPDELANDFATTQAVIHHAIEWLEAEGGAPNALCCLYATAPFVRAEDISDAADLLTDADYVIPVTSFAFPIQRAVKLTPNGRLAMFDPDQYKTRSQDLEEAYHDAGQFYWGKTNAWRDAVPPFGEGTKPLVLPRSRVQDIDTPEDWEQAEAMFRALGLAD
ncbi:pseudaminic acid cytidylyltransferase [Aliiroseovarius sp. YM-037]|uniref:pseudaminic acid cytidylyltransferase n=1 Tax=Aliiroseovarius sp. YM-037 TaxID=3341728 RepID=UPI003A80AA94